MVMKKGLAKFKEAPDSFDIITLDLNLPKMDGIRVAKEIRQISETVPLIMLTARDTESDQVLGLELGADDYVTKPFSPITLIARIKGFASARRGWRQSWRGTSKRRKLKQTDLMLKPITLNSAQRLGKPI